MYKISAGDQGYLDTRQPLVSIAPWSVVYRRRSSDWESRWRGRRQARWFVRTTAETFRRTDQDIHQCRTRTSLSGNTRNTCFAL